MLDKHGFKYAVPEGPYYVMADFQHLGRGDDDMAFARRLNNSSVRAARQPTGILVT
jgi:hypothetical protein